MNPIDKIIKTGKYPPVIFLFGEESFLVDEAKDKIINSLIKNESDEYNFDSLDGEDASPEQAADISAAYPLMSERRVVVIKRAENMFSGRSKKVTSPAFERYLNSPSSKTVLLITASIDSLNGISRMLANPQKKSAAEKKIKSAKFPFANLLENHFWTEFPRVYENQLPDWIIGKFKSSGKKIGSEAVSSLIANTNNNLREISNEIEKILLYTIDKTEISSSDINNIAGKTKQGNVFDLQNAVGRRDLPRALFLIRGLMDKQGEEIGIIAILTRYFIALWKLLEISKTTTNKFQLAGKIGVSPYFIDEYHNAAKNFHPYEIDKAFVYLCQTDEALKTGTGERRYLMENLLLKLLDK